jgi:hypothetical protein
VPVWLLLLCMVLAAYRLTRLIVKDTFPPVLAVRDRLAGGWRPFTDAEWGQARSGGLDRLKPTQPIKGVENRYITRASWSPYWLAELVSCAWCASGWISGAVTAAADLTVGVPAPWLAGFAVWGAASLLASRSWA